MNAPLAGGSTAGLGPADSPAAAPLGAATVVPPSLATFDIDRLLCNGLTTFNPLHRDSVLDCQAIDMRDGTVMLQVAMPHDMTRFFVGLMDSMTGLFRVMNHKAKVSAAQVKTIDPAEIADREKRKQEFTAEVCDIFDGYFAEGVEIKEALRLTNLALKAINHPWATYHLVSSVLRSQGRLRKSGHKARRTA